MLPSCFTQSQPNCILTTDSCANRYGFGVLRPQCGEGPSIFEKQMLLICQLCISNKVKLKKLLSQSCRFEVDQESWLELIALTDQRCYQHSKLKMHSRHTGIPPSSWFCLSHFFEPIFKELPEYS